MIMNVDFWKQVWEHVINIIWIAQLLAVVMLAQRVGNLESRIKHLEGK